ncbi:septum formation initiator family protein, partial [Leifsonia sp. NPDC058292]|uniref:FtsB family cell division protein n=1 Tax=Leifsonia sp. NPDC058292 TaxID=3346428 RepID=UPI0036DD2846
GGPARVWPYRSRWTGAPGTLDRNGHTRGGARRQQGAVGVTYDETGPTGPRSRSRHTLEALLAKPRSRRVPVTMSTGESGAGRWLRGIHFSGFSLVMMGLIILAVVILAPSLSGLVQQRQQIADQQAKVDQLEAQVSDLKDQRARWNDPSYIRSQARDRLYYVMPGETSYLVIDDRPPAAKAGGDAPVSSELQKTETDWLGSLFGSFVGSGLSTATPDQLDGKTPASGSTPTPTTTPGG